MSSMPTVTREFPDMPARIAVLPRDERNFPVPAFVEWIDGRPDFRVVSGAHFARCIRHRLCWICGEKLGRHMAFVIGPMCVCNRVSSEPPSHLDCAQFAARHCPFLSRPLAKRRDLSDLPETHVAGLMIERNPGVCAVWVALEYRIFNAGNGALISLGAPERIEFYAQGRRATRAEIDESITTGLPLLEAIARQEGAGALRAFGEQVQSMRVLVERFA